MFLDENSVWPAREPPRPPKPTRASEGAARLFLVLAFFTAFMPFSLAVLVDLCRFLAERL